MLLIERKTSRQSKSIPRMAAKSEKESIPKLEVEKFDIDPASNLISKCPGGCIPRSAGIKKGQSTARFAVESCESCSLCDVCQSKRQANDYVVRISLKAILVGHENEADEIAPKVNTATPAVNDHDNDTGDDISIENEAVFSALGLKGVFAKFGGVIQSGRKLYRLRTVRIAALACFLIGTAILLVSMGFNTDGVPSGTPDSPDDMMASFGIEEHTDVMEKPSGFDVSGLSRETSNEDAPIVGLLHDDEPQSSSLDVIADSDEKELCPFEDCDGLHSGHIDLISGDFDVSIESGNSDSIMKSTNTEPTGQQNTVPGSDEPLPYLIYVSKNSFTIAVLGLDEDGEYTHLLRTFHTAVGRTSAQTRAGTFTITDKIDWISWADGSFTPFGTKHSGGLWFHGPIYTARDSYTMKTVSYNQIGTNATSGCMRTFTSAALWIYENVDIGTTVIIANDSLYTSTPPKKIDDAQRYDPTDPVVINDMYHSIQGSYY